jgi:hypothetical protein
MPVPIQQSVTNHDLSTRFQGTSTVAASPSAAAETIIATLTLANFGDLSVTSGIRLQGFAAFTVGTNGVSAVLRIRQTNASGTVVVSSGAVTETAANLDELSVLGFDAAPGVSVYVMTLQLASASAASTVSALHLSATIV